jgi:hypothetical protein
MNIEKWIDENEWEMDGKHFVTSDSLRDAAQGKVLVDLKGHDSLADMIAPHIEGWKILVRCCIEDAGDRDDEKSYYQHELKALEDIDQALQAQEARMKASPERLDEFEVWLRTVCFQKPPEHAYDLAKSAWIAALSQSALDIQALKNENEVLRGQVIEECAKACDALPDNKYYHPLSERQETYEHGRDKGIKECAKAIRAKYQALHAEEVSK